MAFRWFDSNYQQRDDIDRTQDAVVSSQNEIANLRLKVDGLTTMVMTLVELLAKDGKLNDETWRAVCEERLRSPFVREEAQRPAEWKCSRCMTIVDPAEANMTANGIVCGACMR